MRLLKANTLQFKEYLGSDIPRYAILSHTWTDDEPSYQDWLRGDPGVTARKGYQKIQFCCLQALQDGLDFVWVDTVCINKESSAELSEAINSMFAWYRDAVRCYAYLADVDSLDGDALERSRWFTRGWTLQELLAPAQVVFFSAGWSLLGNRAVLLDRLVAITRIEADVLLDEDALAAASVAEKMSWASRRTTTRIEDMAYCMLGILDVNMPLLYGEGDKAFLRLQREIIQHSNDMTLFCWNLPPGWEDAYESLGIFAPNPTAFLHSSKFEVERTDSELETYQASADSGLVTYTVTNTYTLTNAGLQVRLPAMATRFGLLAVLPEVRTRSTCMASSPHCVGIGVAKSGPSSDRYARLPSPAQPVFLPPVSLPPARPFFLDVRPQQVRTEMQEMVRPDPSGSVLFALNDRRLGYGLPRITSIRTHGLEADLQGYYYHMDPSLGPERRTGIILGGICAIEWASDRSTGTVTTFIGTRAAEAGSARKSWWCKKPSARDLVDLADGFYSVPAQEALRRVISEVGQESASEGFLPTSWTTRQDLDEKSPYGSASLPTQITVEIRDDNNFSPGSATYHQSDAVFVISVGDAVVSWQGI